MTVDFAEHFWGDKHMGFSVLYQNMKVGQITTKELSDFLKEQASLEEDYGKHLAKSMNKVSAYSQSGHTISTVWVLMKNALERIGQAQSRLASTLAELGKEVQKYGEELHKTHRALKDKEHGTFDAVNMIQTTTTCVQKAKETYTSRCVELEKLKRENGAPKELNRAENKVTKAREEYKQYVEKYSNVRNTFEEKMSNSARSFQEQETRHIERMKALLANYSLQKEEASNLGAQVFSELRLAVEHMNTEDILTELIKNKDTGAEKPGIVSFEEPDLNALLPPVTIIAPSDTYNRQSSEPPPTGNLLSLSPNHPPTSLGPLQPVSNGPLLTHTNSVPMPTLPESQLISLGNGEHLTASLPSQGTGLPPDQSSTSSSASSSMTHSISKGKGLSLFSRSKKSASPATTPTTDLAASVGTTPSDQGTSEKGDSPGRKMKNASGIPAPLNIKHSSTTSLDRITSLQISPKKRKKKKKKKGGGQENAAIVEEDGAEVVQQRRWTDDAPTEEVDLHIHPEAEGLRLKRKVTFLSMPEERRTFFARKNQAASKSLPSIVEANGREVPPVTNGYPPLTLRHLEQSPKAKKKYTEFGNSYARRSSKWFFKRTGRKKGKAKESVSYSMTRGPTEGSEESRSNASEEQGQVLVDEEGFTIRPHQAKEEENKSDKWSSDDSDDDEPKKIQVQIKPLSPGGPPRLAGSVDELRDVVGTLRKPPTPTAGFLPPSSGLFSDDFNQTMPAGLNSLLPKTRTAGGTGSMDNDPWAPTAPSGRKLMQPSYTGDGRLNYSFAGVGSGFATARSTSRSSMPSGPMKPELTGPRQRPRPSAQPHLISLDRRESSTELDSSGMGMNFSQRTISMSSLGDISNDASPRGPSPSTTDVIPVAMAVTETVHALFHGADVTKGRIRVFGSVHVSFPGSSLASLLDENSSASPLTFRLNKAERVHALIPNKAVLSADAVSQFSSSAFHQFSFDTKGLAVQLRKLCDQRPGAPFYNLEVLRYEVRNPVAPLLLMSFWKCEASQTDVRVDYRLNMDCPVEKALLNLQFLTPVSGGVLNVVAKPDADWSKENEKLLWKLTELSKHGDSHGSLKGRVTLSDGPSKPAPTAVQFQVTEACLSGASLEVECDNYRLSLLKRKMISGKYICEPETR